jgi:5S rRNA maturation endonuclease (ribonuclease M5)
MTPTKSKKKPRIVAEYDYRDEKGHLLYQSVRYDPKDFRQRQPDGSGGWIWNLEGVQRVLYRLLDLDAAPRSRPVFVVEGEKDVESLRKINVLATTNAMGAGKWDKCYTKTLRGRHVIIIPDNDDAGRKHACAVAAALKGVAASVKVVELPDLPEKGDMTDWLLVKGNDKEALLELVQAAPPEADEPPAADPQAPAGEGAADGPGPEGVAEIIGLDKETKKPINWLWPYRFAMGKFSLLEGDPDQGKSTLLLDLAARVSTNGVMPDGSQGPVGNVIIMSAEDGVADTILPCVEAAGANLARIHYFKAVGKGPIVLPLHLKHLREQIVKLSAPFCIIDPIASFLESARSEQEVRQMLYPIKEIFEEVDCALISLRHLNKSGGQKALYRGSGFIAYAAAARSVYAVGEHPDEHGLHVFAVVKNNLAPKSKQTSLTYRLDPVSEQVARIAWVGSCALTANDLVKPPDEPGEQTALQEAVSILEAFLKDGPKPAGACYEAGATAKISPQTMRRAKAKLKIGHYQGAGKFTESSWALPLSTGAPELPE